MQVSRPFDVDIVSPVFSGEPFSEPQVFYCKFRKILKTIILKKICKGLLLMIWLIFARFFCKIYYLLKRKIKGYQS